MRIGIHNSITIALSILLLVRESIEAPSFLPFEISISSSAPSTIDITKTLSLAKSLSSHSWEWGTAIEASIEVNNPELSVFSKNAFPNGKVPIVTGTGQKIDGLAYAKQKIKTDGTSLADGAGAIGDPASMGVGAILLGAATSSKNQIYKSAAQRQLTTILNAPKFYNGALSQRESIAELWADNVFMTPPFLAYSAVAANNLTLLRQAVNQCTLYRQVLQANTTSSWKGLWTHIVGPQSQTLGIWATGNGWAALGMVRVLATIKNWRTSSSWSTEQGQLTQYIMEIINGARNVPVDPQTGFYRNYIVGGADSQNDTSVVWFGDGAGTAALAASALRLAVIQPSLSSQLISFAKPLLTALAKHTDKNGLLAPTVDPLDWYTTKPFTSGSPEGQSFISMAGAAWRDCVSANVCHSNVKKKSRAKSSKTKSTKKSNSKKKSKSKKTSKQSSSRKHKSKGH